MKTAQEAITDIVVMIGYCVWSFTELLVERVSKTIWNIKVDQHE